MCESRGSTFSGQFLSAPVCIFFLNFTSFETYLHTYVPNLPNHWNMLRDTRRSKNLVRTKQWIKKNITGNLLTFKIPNFKSKVEKSNPSKTCLMVRTYHIMSVQCREIMQMLGWNDKKTRSDKNWPLTDMVTDVTTLPSDSPLIYAMASCHSLIKLNGELTGNPLDVKVFESIEWELKVNIELIRSNYESTNLFSPIFLSWKKKKY